MWTYDQTPARGCSAPLDFRPCRVSAEGHHSICTRAGQTLVIRDVTVVTLTSEPQSCGGRLQEPTFPAYLFFTCCLQESPHCPRFTQKDKQPLAPAAQFPVANEETSHGIIPDHCTALHCTAPTRSPGDVIQTSQIVKLRLQTTGPETRNIYQHVLIDWLCSQQVHQTVVEVGRCALLVTPESLLSVEEKVGRHSVPPVEHFHSSSVSWNNRLSIH